jgi:ABC-type amino acid transport substrate-binding protein
MEDLHGQKLAVEFGSGGDVEARDWERRLADLDVLRYDSPGAALLAVVNGEADAALVDGITARLGVGEHPDLHIAQNVNDVLLAAAVAENSPVLRGLVDQAMRDMLADGTVQALIDHWFGVDG